MIPQLSHQRWKTEDIPERVEGNAAAWRRHHPGWTYRLWTDEAIDTFVREEFPDVWPLFRSYPDRIQRVDAARYMILHRPGGLYNDLDCKGLHPFDAPWVHDAVLAGTTLYNPSSDLTMTAPGHPLFADSSGSCRIRSLPGDDGLLRVTSAHCSRRDHCT